MFIWAMVACCGAMLVGVIVELCLNYGRCREEEGQDERVATENPGRNGNAVCQAKQDDVENLEQQRDPENQVPTEEELQEASPVES